MKITLHDEHQTDTLEDSLARLVDRQVVKIKELSAELKDLGAAAVEAYDLISWNELDGTDIERDQHLKKIIEKYRPKEA